MREGARGRSACAVHGIDRVDGGVCRPTKPLTDPTCSRTEVHDHTDGLWQRRFERVEHGGEGWSRTHHSDHVVRTKTERVGTLESPERRLIEHFGNSSVERHIEGMPCRDPAQTRQGISAGRMASVAPTLLRCAATGRLEGHGLAYLGSGGGRRGSVWPGRDRVATNPPTRLRAAAILGSQELALMASLYSIWRLARVLPLARPEGAIDRARQIDDLQQSLHMPTELSLQHFVLRHDWLAQFSNAYYAIAHVPGLIAFLVWLFVRHRDVYPRWRNPLAIVTALCVVIRFVRVAPPRFLPDLGYIDLATRYGMSLYGPVGTGVSDQFAAMPSIHVGWAAVVSFGVVAASTSRWRWIFLLHLILTMIVVSATGNHWWLDGIVAMVLVVVGIAIDRTVRRITMSRRAPRSGDLWERGLVKNSVRPVTSTTRWTPIEGLSMRSDPPA